MEVLVEVKCPVCKKLHSVRSKETFRDNEVDTADIQSGTIYRELVCNSCKSYREAYTVCEVCGVPVKFKNDLVGISVHKTNYCKHCIGINIAVKDKKVISYESCIRDLNYIVSCTEDKSTLDILKTVVSSLDYLLSKENPNQVTIFDSEHKNLIRRYREMPSYDAVMKSTNIFN